MTIPSVSWNEAHGRGGDLVEKLLPRDHSVLAPGGLVFRADYHEPGFAVGVEIYSKNSYGTLSEMINKVLLEESWDTRTVVFNGGEYYLRHTPEG